jgi:hypothetical protein
VERQEAAVAEREPDQQVERDGRDAQTAGKAVEQRQGDDDNPELDQNERNTIFHFIFCLV